MPYLKWLHEYIHTYTVIKTQCLTQDAHNRKNDLVIVIHEEDIRKRAKENKEQIIADLLYFFLTL